MSPQPMRHHLPTDDGSHDAKGGGAVSALVCFFTAPVSLGRKTDQGRVTDRTFELLESKLITDAHHPVLCPKNPCVVDST